jgi:transposase-like protein
MVSHVYQCPHCGQSERIVRRGFNRCGTQRLLCRECGKTWTPAGKSRELSREKEALIEKALGERLSQRAIARTLGVSRDTVRAVLKKSPSKAV